MKANLLEQEMHHYFMQLNEEEKKYILLMIKTFLKGKMPEANQISIEQFNKELEEAEREIEEGKFITQDALEKEMEKW